ncbi:MAG: hypothetical protein IPK82_07230 [Polyangiaceae bacterium]|nr:hypothetical protein [Polyangiaceae bacterium]
MCTHSSQRNKNLRVDYDLADIAAIWGFVFPNLAVSIRALHRGLVYT